MTNTPCNILSQPPTIGSDPVVDRDFWATFWRQQGRAATNQVPQAQVLRTQSGKPLPQGQFEPIVEHTLNLLKPAPHHDALDLCCGNGLITLPLLNCCRTVLAIDISSDLIAVLKANVHPQLSTQVADVRNAELPESCFDRVLLYAALQYFSPLETLALLHRVHRSLRPGGMFLVGDIPDANRQWQFFSSAQRRVDYFQNLEQGTPLIGFWFDAEWLKFAGEYVGFASQSMHLQPETFPYAHFRFDMLFRRTA